MSNLAIIPARSGSKGFPNKNIKELNGIPLLAYTINSAIESRKFDEIFVSTDSKKYAKIAETYGANVPFLRSVENSRDSASSWDVVKEVVKQFEKGSSYFDKIMLLQPTSPLRTSEDIRSSFQLMEEKNANAILSVTMAEHSPIWCNTLDDDLCMDTFQNEEYIGVPRQQLPVFYRLNGAIYLLKREELEKKIMFKKKCFAYIMPNERSVDIDTEWDFKLIEYYLKKNKVW